MQDSEYINLFIVNIQFGAILSVIVLYWKRFFQSLDFYYKLIIAFLPAAFVGFFAEKYIDSMLNNPLVVACSLVIGGILLLFVDNWFLSTENNQQLNYSKALKIGLFQVIAMIPGVSRSAATIIGGMVQKLNRKNAAEFSFFLAVPTMFAASSYKLFESYKTLTFENVGILVFGNVIAFIVALIAIRSFILFLTKNGFKLFGWYRIFAGILIIILIFLGKIDLK